MKRYTKEHEWVRLEGDVAIVGISRFATEKLGDIVSVDFPELGAVLKAGDEFAAVDSVKATSGVYAPLSGKIVELNDAIQGSPETINADPEGAGWFCRIAFTDRGEFDALMDQAAYDAFVANH